MHMDNKVTPTDNTDYNYHIKPYNLFNQSYGVYITPLVINSLRSGHTDTHRHTQIHTDTHRHTHTSIQTFVERSTSEKSGAHQPAV